MKKILFLIFFITSLFSQNLQKTSIQLMWLDQFQFAGFYMAKEQGFYENVGLDVEIKKFNSNINITDEVLNKRADFGVNSTSLFVDKSQNKNIVLLGAIFQTSPLMVLALENSSIDSVQDFKNKKLMITQEQLGFATFKAMLSSNGVNISDMKILPHSYNVDDLIDKKTDLMLSYTTNEPFLLKEKSYESRIFHPKDYGFNFYEELLFTSEELANSKPKLVNDFYKASILGWIWAFNNIDESVDIIYNKYNSQNKSKEALLFEANEMKKLVLDEFGNIGTLNKDKLNLIINTYKVMGLIKNDINLEDFVFNNAILDIRLNSEEQNYLKQKKSITYYSHSDLMPFEAILDNKHIGFTEDYINYISKTLGVEFEFIPTSHWSESLKKTIENSCDILTTIASKKDREELLNFTKPIIEFPFVLVTDTVKPFIENINKLENVKIALVKGFATTKIIKERYKNLNFVEYNSLRECLDAVRKGEVYAAIDSLAVVGYEIQNHFAGELKVSGKVDEKLELFMATNINNKTLASVLDKTLDSIGDKQKQEFLNKWVYIKYEESLNSRLISQISILFIVVFLVSIFLYRAYLLKKTNKELEIKVAQEIAKNEENNQILMQQSKMAAMGEMLENIAHQWRQPLSTISVCTTGLELKKEMNVLSDDDFYDSINHIKSSILYLTNTIEDFRNFLNKEKIISNIDVNSLITKVLDILMPSFKSHNIEVVKNIEDIHFASFENELIQVLINILTNAKDALKELENRNRYIFIDIKKFENSVNIEIYDNALGIKKEILTRVFEPYFTTKHRSQGTGIGLYMSKLLVEKHLLASIFAENYKYSYNNNNFIGAKFTIKLPLKLDNQIIKADCNQFVTK